MASIAEIRQQFPEYSALPDQALADKMHDKFYHDMPKEDFYKKIQFEPAANKSEKGSWTDFIKAIPHGVMSGLGATASAMGQAESAEMTGGQMQDLPSAAQATQALEKNVTGQLPDPQSRPGRFGHTVGEFLGNPGSYIGPGSLPIKALTATTSALGSEAAGELTEGAGPKTEAVGRVLGSIFGGSFPRGMAKFITPLPTHADRLKTVDFLRSEGIEPEAGQVTGRRSLRYAESALGGAPGAGGASERDMERIAGEFTAAVNRKMGVDSPKATPEVIRDARKQLGDQFEQSTKNLRVRFDQKYYDDVSKWAEEILREGLPEEDTNRIIQQARNLAGGFVEGKTGEMPYMSGTTYHSATKYNSSLARAIDSPNADISYFSTKLRSILDDALERTATGRGTQAGKGMRKAIEDFRDARRKWHNMLVISKAASGAGEGAAAGYVSPQKLRQMLTSSDDKKLQYAAGKGDLHDLARAGSEILTVPPTSTTTERAFVHAVPAALGSAAAATAAGAPFALPGAVAGLAAPGLIGRGLLSSPIQSYLKNQSLSEFIETLPSKKATALRSILESLPAAQ